MSITIISDAPNCGITYNCHYDDRNSFIIQATVYPGMIGAGSLDEQISKILQKEKLYEVENIEIVQVRMRWISHFSVMTGFGNCYKTFSWCSLFSEAIS